MGTKAQLRAYLDAQDGHVGGAKYWEYVYGWSGGGLPFCAVGVSAALKATDTKCPYFPSKVAFDRRDKSVIGSRWVNRDNLEYLDAIAFDWDADGSGDHVGFFLEYIGGGRCRTFEFNVSNSCGYRTRYVSDIIGGIRPYYASSKKEEDVYDFKTIKRGSHGNEVMLLQSALNIRQHSGFALDGDFGPYTDAEVRRWQSDHGLYADGICGPKTWPTVLGK